MTRPVLIFLFSLSFCFVNGQNNDRTVDLISGLKQGDTVYIHLNRRDFITPNFDNRSETFLLRNKKGKLLMTSRLQHFKYKAKTISLTIDQIAFLKRLGLPAKTEEKVYDEYNIIKLEPSSFFVNRPIQYADTLRSFFINKYFDK